MKVARAYLFSIAVLFFWIISIRASVEEKLNISLGFRDFLIDAIVGEFLGGKEASPEVQQLVRSKMKEVGMANADDIRIRKIRRNSSFTRQVDTLDILLFPKYIYVDESYLKEFLPKEQDFLIGHAIMCLKNRHGLIKKLAPFFGHYLAGNVFNRILPSFHMNIDGYREDINYGQQIFSMIVSSWLNRLCVFHADHQAAKKFGNFDGGIAIMEKFEKYERECKEEMPQWKLLVWKRLILVFLKSVGITFFDCSPSYSFRKWMLERK